MGFSLQIIQVATTEKEIVSLILIVKVIPTQIIGISREIGNCTETVVLWTTNERGLKKSGIPEMIGMWFWNTMEISTVEAVLCIRLSILPCSFHSGIHSGTSQKCTKYMKYCFGRVLPTTPSRTQSYRDKKDHPSSRRGGFERSPYERKTDRPAYDHGPSMFGGTVSQSWSYARIL